MFLIEDNSENTPPLFTKLSLYDMGLLSTPTICELFTLIEFNINLNTCGYTSHTRPRM